MYLVHLFPQNSKSCAAQYSFGPFSSSRNLVSYEPGLTHSLTSSGIGLLTARLACFGSPLCLILLINATSSRYSRAIPNSSFITDILPRNLSNRYRRDITVFEQQASIIGYCTMSAPKLTTKTSLEVFLDHLSKFIAFRNFIRQLASPDGLWE